MRTPDTIEKEVNEIRLILYEKTKGMTSEEITKYYRKSGEATAQKYGFKLKSYKNSPASMPTLLTQ
jgi:hypothetical protein